MWEYQNKVNKLIVKEFLNSKKLIRRSMLYDSACDTWKILVWIWKKQRNAAQPISIISGEKWLKWSLHVFDWGKEAKPTFMSSIKTWRLGSGSQDPHSSWCSWQMLARGRVYVFFARKSSSSNLRKGKLHLEIVFLSKHGWAHPMPITVHTPNL